MYEPHLGISYQRKPYDKRQDEFLQSIDQKVALGFEIVRLDEGGPAERAGLTIGDTIVQVEGRELLNSNEITEVALASPWDRPTRISVLRVGGGGGYHLLESQLVINR